MLPAVVVAERPSGVTQADLDFLAERGAAIARIDGVAGPPAPPEPSEDGEAAQFVVPIVGGRRPRQRSSWRFATSWQKARRTG